MAELFIEKAKQAHGDKYDYSKVDYINSSTKVIILCQTHGEFLQTPNKHLMGRNCSKCSGKFMDTNFFIENAKQVHGDKYDYSKVDYIKNTSKVIIICPTHGEFEQNPSGHLSGNNCQKCVGGIKYNTEEFIKKAIDIHGNKYEYSKVNYINSTTTIIIICKEHGDFNQNPRTHLTSGGCPKCGKNIRSDKRKTPLDNFIIRATEIHNNKYNYSKVIYNNAKSKIIIICPIHGDFEQRPDQHLNKKSGCVKCSIQINSDKQRKTTDQFILDAKKIHNEKYDYSKVEYKNVSEKVLIICHVHGEFEQTPNGHLNGAGCIKCSGTLKKTNNEFIDELYKIYGDTIDYSSCNYINRMTNVIIKCPIHNITFTKLPSILLNGSGCPECSRGYHILNNDIFIKKAIEKHGNIYDYSKVNYVKSCKKVIITCLVHGDFEQAPNGHLSGHGCIICGIQKASHKKLSNTVEFINKSSIIHNNLYNYELVDYTKSQNKIIIICPYHGQFKQTASNHLNGQGCPLCRSEKIKNGLNLSNTEDFIQKSKLLFGNIYDYSLTIYTNQNNKVKLICKKHNYSFEQSPKIHFRKMYGCAKCSKCGFSKTSINYLNFIATYYNIYIQHAENDGEYTIPTTKYKADGYCHETNTIYEYHGSYWHGDPNIYDENEINKVTKKTFGELYANTQKKEQLIKDMGYNLVVMWEINWIKINISISILQNKFRKKY